MPTGPPEPLFMDGVCKKWRSGTTERSSGMNPIQLSFRSQKLPPPFLCVSCGNHLDCGTSLSNESIGKTPSMALQLGLHYFDFQSFVNLPHKSVQLHKTPPSQAGIDPSAAWAPKSMKLAGKNRSAPAARANRNNVEVKRSGGRYGIPTKLEFRNWGERHGELRSERIIPHKDTWMASLDGDFKHFYEEVEHGVIMHRSHRLRVERKMVEDEKRFVPPLFSTHHLFTGRQKAVVKLLDREVDVLLILTLAKPHNAREFLTISVRAVRGLSDEEKPFVKLLLYEGIQLLEQRSSGFSKRQRSRDHYHDYDSMSDSAGSSPKSRTSNVNRSAPVYTNHNGGPAGLLHHHAVRPNGPGVAPHEENGALNESSSEAAEAEQSAIGESFLFMYPPKRLQRCHLLVQIFIREGDDENERLVGYCVLGDVGIRYRPFDPIASALDKGAQHWQQALRHNGRPICGWHIGLPVRPNLETRRRCTAATTSEQCTPTEEGGRLFTPDLAELKLREARIDLGVPTQVSSSLPSVHHPRS